MISIPVAVEEVVKKKPFLEGALVDGLINLSALARQIKPEVEERIGKTVNDSAVIMALNRLVPRLELMSAMKIKNVVENMGDIVVRSNLSDFTFLNTSTLYGLQARLLNEVHSLKNVFCTFSQGIYETTLVVSDSIVPLVKELFANERIISSNTNLSLITVRLPSENTACPCLLLLVQGARLGQHQHRGGHQHRQRIHNSRRRPRHPPRIHHPDGG